jgi:hypothetical protein
MPGWIIWYEPYVFFELFDRFVETLQFVVGLSKFITCARILRV